MTGTDDILARNAQADLLRFTTAGSVDDGKSTLIGRLFYDSKSIFEDHLSAMESDSRRLNRDSVDYALLTDGLKAEREQGITIDVAYRYFSTPNRRFIIADTPGHEQYTRNMVTGASTANLAVVLIDAKNGVLTQSKRHGFIASLLGIPHVLVAVNKMDLVDFSESVFEEIRGVYNEFAAKLDIQDLVYIPISALHGDNVVQPSQRMPWYGGPTFLRHLETVYIGSDRNLVDFRFPVQYVNRPTSSFRGYCGTVCSGVVRPGDEVVSLPSGQQTTVERVHTFDGDIAFASPTRAVTLCLAGELDISRGDMLAHPRNTPRVERTIEAMLVWMDQTPLREGRTYLVKHASRLVKGIVSRVQYRVDPNELHREAASELRLNEIGRVDLELLRPILCDAYQRNRTTGSFVLIDPDTHATAAAGMIIERAHHGETRPRAETRPRSANITRESGFLDADERASLFGHGAATVWLTGLSGVGKSTIARLLERRLFEERCASYVLDGDNVRHGLNRDLGFDLADRSENIRRVAEVARLMTDAGQIVVTSFISPLREDRDQARQTIGAARFFEVFLDAPLDVCEQRDPKGLYRRARAGEIPGFTGVSSPYEPPQSADLRIDTSACPPEQAVDRIVELLRQRGVLPAAPGAQ